VLVFLIAIQTVCKMLWIDTQNCSANYSTKFALNIRFKTTGLIKLALTVKYICFHVFSLFHISLPCAIYTIQNNIYRHCMSTIDLAVWACGTHLYFTNYCILYFRASFNYRLINLYSNSLINYAVYTLKKSIAYIIVMWPYALHFIIHID
jgi:hypothetical protein